MSIAGSRPFAQIATRFSRVFIKLSEFKFDPVNHGVFGGSPLLVIQAPPSQSVDIFQIVDSNGNVLYSIGPNGRPVSSPPAKAITGGSANSLATVAVPASAMVGGVIHYLVQASDGTNFQALEGIVTYSAVNAGGTVTGTITEVAANQAKTVSSGTLTVAWTIVPGTNNVTIKVQPTTSLTATTLNVLLSISPTAGGAPTML